MAKFPGNRSRKRNPVRTLRSELEWHIEAGRCAYCRAQAQPDGPLTREHVIPRARGGRRRDVRIIVPACARCNRERGCRDLIPFLLMRPGRIAGLLDYFSALSQASIREVDPRIFAELYAALAILCESGTALDWSAAASWRRCSGRSLHRRRYAARRTLAALDARFRSVGGRHFDEGTDSRLRTATAEAGDDEVTCEGMVSQLLAILALLWGVSAEAVKREIRRVSATTAYDPAEDQWSDEGGTLEDVLAIRRRGGNGRVRVDQRRGRGARRRIGSSGVRGRAA